MVLALGLLACVALWWFAKSRGGLGPALASLPRHWLGGWAALAAAGLMLLHGNLIVAALFGVGGLWALEGPGGLGRRMRRVIPSRPSPGRQIRTRLLVMTMTEEGRPGGGRVQDGPVAGPLTGPLAGARLDALAPPALGRLWALCLTQDPEGAALLEAYLDRRAPGWRVDAQGDRDPGTGSPSKPGAMTQEEAYQILGLERGAPAEQIRTAHRTLMKRAHPDQGGSAEGAARLNAARDHLLSRHR
jgi:hypothetical protein